MREDELDPVDDPRIQGVARAIADGTPVEWTDVEASLSNRRGLARQLQTLHGIATVHRSLENLDDDAVAEVSTADQAWWGSLRILGLVGRGAFGAVYRAWDSRLDREVALKLLHQRATTPGATDLTVASTFVDEARLLARVRHSNVLTVFGAETIDGRSGLWTEFIRGRTLNDITRESGPLSAIEAAAIGIDLCRALSAVHHAGLLHRDVKAQNVMRAEGGRIVLMDFGAGHERTISPTSGDVDPAGTPLYVAPEILTGGPASVQSDVYSLGVLLYYIVAGTYPLVGATVAELTEALRSSHRRWLRDARPDLPSGFVEVVERAIDRDPAKRYQTAGAFEAALVHWQGSAASTQPHRARAWFAIGAAGAAVALVLVGLSGVWSTRGPSVTRTDDAPRIALADSKAQTKGDSPERAGEAPPDAHSGGRAFGARPEDPASAPGGSTPPSGAAATAESGRGRDRGMAIEGTSELSFALPITCNENCRPSPDGRYVVRLGGGDVWLWQTDTGERQQVTKKDPASPEGAELGAAVSFDGSQIAYAWRTLEGPYSLRVIRSDGTGARAILAMDAVALAEPLEWSRDGTRILTFLTRPNGRLDLALVPSAGAEPVILTTFHAGRPRVSLSPDGRFVVYDDRPAPAGAQRLMIMATDGSAPRVLFEENAHSRSPLWTPDGRHVFFVSERSGEPLGWLLPVERGVRSGEPTLVKTALAGATVIALTTDGRLFYWLRRRAGSVQTMSIAPDADLRSRTPTAVPARTLTGHSQPSWSPDGRRLAFVSNQPTGQTLTIADVDSRGYREVPLALGGIGRFGGTLPQWSPDERFVTIRGRDSGSRNGFFNVDVGTGEVTPVLLFDRQRNEGEYGSFRWSLSGRELLYGHRPRGIVARTVATGEERVIVPHAGPFVMSPTGDRIAFVQMVGLGQDRTSVVMLSTGGSVRELHRIPAPEHFAVHAWSPDGLELLVTTYVLSSPGVGLNQLTAKVWRLLVTDGRLVDTGLRLPPTIGWAVAVSPDGRRLAYAPVGDPVAEQMYVAQGFLKAPGK